MLPDVDADDGHVAEERVLVRGRDDLELLGVGVVPEPAPAGALDRGGNGVHLLFERWGRRRTSVQAWDREEMVREARGEHAFWATCRVSVPLRLTWSESSKRRRLR